MPDVTAVRLSLALIGVYLVISSAELLVRRRALADGLLSWQTARLTRLLDYRVILFVLVMRAIAGAVLIWGGGLVASACVAAAATSLAISVRLVYGSDGADQFASIALVSFALTLPFGARAVHAALFFVAFQSLLAYTTAGTTKLLSHQWRDGSGLLALTGTKTFGMPSLHKVLASHRTVTMAASWSVIAVELSIIVLFAGGSRTLQIGLLLALLFHVAAALVMRLHTFVWSFAAAFPALFWARGALERLMN
ncbi:MAG TPA: hypothetical protein VG323_07075 [Thermoanaerobaculia bacterium]|nr:hypothetical protein [Thermoanaerobaculia bacterium]